MIRKGAFTKVIRKGTSSKFLGQFHSAGVPIVKMQQVFPGATSEYLRKKKMKVKSYPGEPQILIPLSTSGHKIPRVLSHEMGHAFDYALMKRRAKKQQIFEKESMLVRAFNEGMDVVPSSTLKKTGYEAEAKKISKRMFGGWGKTHDIKYQLYRQKPTELFADVYSSFVLEPRAFKREAPTLAKLFKNL